MDVDGLPHHEECSGERLAYGECGGCGRAIEENGEVARVEDEDFHKECFKCHGCDSPITDELFVRVDGVLYHKRCEPLNRIDGCRKCGKPLTTQVVKTQGIRYHKECFVCDGCKKPFDSTFLEFQGRNYHDECVPTGKAATKDHRCTACRAEIGEGKFLEIDGRNYHPHCFVCVKCKGPFKADEGYVEEGGPRHQRCE